MKSLCPLAGTMKLVDDRIIAADILPDRWEEKTVYLKDGAVWQVGMK